MIMKKNEGKKCCISCGVCNKKFCYIFVGLILLNLILYVIILLFQYYFMINKEKFKIDIMMYLFYLNVGESLMIIPDLILKKFTTSINANSFSLQKTIFIRKFLFKNNSAEFSRKDKIYFLIFAAIKLVLDVSYILYFYYFIGEYDFSKLLIFVFNFEILFLFLLSKIMYNIKFYRHQYLSIVILVILELIRLIIDNFKKGTDKFFIILIYHIIYSFFKSLMTVYIKGLMEYKYFSPYKACYKFGLINLIIVFIIHIIVTLIPCKSNMCVAVYHETSYFGNIILIFTIPGLFLFIFLIFRAIVLILNYITIHYFSVCHCFLLIHSSILFDVSPFKNLGEIIAPQIIFIVLLYYILGFFFILLFLEIIELNICGLSYNTKKNIEERAMLDIENFNINCIRDESNEENEEEEREETEKNKGIEIYKIYS